MKKMVINVASCDTRNVTEETLAAYESVTINAALVVTGDRSKELLAKHNVEINAASIVYIPESIGVSLTKINGRHEIGAESFGEKVFLIVNGVLTFENGSLEAASSYYKILLNGKAIMPNSFKGKLPNLSVNGKTLYYPDGATLIKSNTEIDDLFIMRAGSKRYHAPGMMFFLDNTIDTDKLSEKNLTFSSGKIIMVESLLPKLIPHIDEETEIVKVPDGTVRVDNDLELNDYVIKEYGKKLFVSGDMSIEERSSLLALEYLNCTGRISLNGDLCDDFDKLGAIYGELKVRDTSVCYITDKPFTKIGKSMLKKHPGGICVEDCACVNLSEDLTAQEIEDMIKISDCALIRCSKEQEEAVNMIARDVAKIDVRGAGDDDGEKNKGMLGEIFENIKDARIINAAEYSL